MVRDIEIAGEPLD